MWELLPGTSTCSTLSHEAHLARPGPVRDSAGLLRSDGWDALHVTDAGLDRAEDIQILEFARRDNRTCVTLDHDFHAHLALAMSGPLVVLVRLEGLVSDRSGGADSTGVGHVCGCHCRGCRRFSRCGVYSGPQATATLSRDLDWLPSLDTFRAFAAQIPKCSNLQDSFVGKDIGT